MTSTLGRLLALLRPSARLVAGAVLAAAVSAAAAAGYAWLIGPLLRSVLLSEPLHVGGLTSPPERARWLLPGLLILLAVVKAGAQLLQTGWMQVAGQRALARMRSDLYAHLLALPPATHESRASGDVLSRLTADVAQVEFSVTQALTSWVRDALQLLALLGVCLALDWRLFALSFVVFPAALLPITRFARAVKKAARATQGSLGNLTALVGEQLQALPVVQAYGMEPRVRTQFDAEQARYLREMDRSLLLRGAASPSIELLGITGLALALAVGARAVRAEPSLASHLMSYVGAVLLMYGPLKTLSSTVTQVVAGVGAAERVFELEDRSVPPDSAQTSMQALKAGQVDVLVIAKDYDPGNGWECRRCGKTDTQSAQPDACPACRSHHLRGYEIRSELVRLAGQLGCGVEVVEHSDPLMNLGGVGCLLRFLAPERYSSQAA